MSLLHFIMSLFLIILDVDLIVDRGNVRTYKDYFHFCEELEKELGTDVDVTAEEGMLPGFFDLVKNDRILLYGA